MNEIEQLRADVARMKEQLNLMQVQQEILFLVRDIRQIVRDAIIGRDGGSLTNLNNGKPEEQKSKR